MTSPPVAAELLEGWLCSREFLIASLGKQTSSEYSFWSKAHPAARLSRIKHPVFGGISRSSGTAFLLARAILRSQQKTSSATISTFVITYSDSGVPKDSAGTQSIHAKSLHCWCRGSGKSRSSLFATLDFPLPLQPHPPRKHTYSQTGQDHIAVEIYP